MLYGIPTKDTRTDNERYLQEQLDAYRERENRRRDEEFAERKERRRESARRTMDELRSANDWPTALRNQSTLCRLEAGYPDDEVDDFFTGTADACDYALEIWPSHAAAVAADIEQLQQQIQRLRDSVRFSVAAEVAAKAQGVSGWKDTAATLADPDADMDAWLNW